MNWRVFFEKDFKRLLPRSFNQIGDATEFSSFNRMILHSLIFNEL